MDPYVLVLGGENANVVTIRDKILDSANLGEQWKDWAKIELGIPGHVVLLLERGINTSTKIFSEVVYEILTKWKARKGDDATLETLYTSLENSNMRDAADSIRVAVGYVPH